MLTRLLIFVLLLQQSALSGQEIIRLYKELPPGSLPVADMESGANSTAGNQRFFLTNVTNPTLTVFLPKKMNGKHSAIIICPGGGYNRLSIEDGGYEAAKAFAEKGIAAFVLKYRTTRDSAYTDYKQVPLLDLKKATEIVYERAKEWDIDSNKIGFLGFSAGGHLAAMGSTTFTGRKPAFTLLAYPIISFTDSLTSKTSNSRNNLLGKQITEDDKIRFSPELHITNSTPPAFLVHALDDNTAPAGNSLAYYNNLKKNNIPAKILLYEKGGHGFALYNKAEDKSWLPEALDWMEEQGLLIYHR